MKKILKGEPISVRFSHVCNDSMKKTIARANITEYNVPYNIRSKFLEMFVKNEYTYEVPIYAETICKDETYDPEIGERIARKKLMRHFMSMMNQAAKATMKELQEQENDLYDVIGYTQDCEDRIVEWLKKQ